MLTSHQLEPGQLAALSRLSPSAIQILRALSRYISSSSLLFTVFADYLQSIRLGIVILPLNPSSNLLSCTYFPRTLLDNYPAPCRGPPPSTPNLSSTSAGALPMALLPPSPPSTCWASCATPLPPSHSITHH